MAEVYEVAKKDKIGQLRILKIRINQKLCDLILYEEEFEEGLKRGREMPVIHR